MREEINYNYLNGVPNAIKSWIYENPSKHLSNEEIEKSNYYFKMIYNTFNYFYALSKDIVLSKKLTELINGDKKMYNIIMRRVIPMNLIKKRFIDNTNLFMLSNEEKIVSVIQGFKVGDTFTTEELAKRFEGVKEGGLIAIMKMFFTLKKHHKLVKLDNRMIKKLYYRIVNERPYDLDLTKLIMIYETSNKYPTSLSFPKLKKDDNNFYEYQPYKLSDIIIIRDNRTNEIVYHGSISNARNVGFVLTGLVKGLTSRQKLIYNDYLLTLEKTLNVSNG